MIYHFAFCNAGKIETLHVLDVKILQLWKCGPTFQCKIQQKPESLFHFTERTLKTKKTENAIMFSTETNRNLGDV